MCRHVGRDMNVRQRHCSALFSQTRALTRTSPRVSTSLSQPFCVSSSSSSIPFNSHFSSVLKPQISPPRSSTYTASHRIMAHHLPLKAVTLTHVRYQKGDRLGHFLAWVSLVPVFISLGGFVSHFIFRRELQALFFAIGLSISQFISELIKKSVQQARPETCALLEMCDSHGWPSSHSQYMFFFATYFTLMTINGIGTVNKWIPCVLPWSLAVLTMYSRVYLGYHTVAQVFAGATLGVLLGSGWFWLVNAVICKYFPVIEESWLGRIFYVKDTSHIQNVLKFEYDNARAARKTSSEKSD